MWKSGAARASGERSGLHHTGGCNNAAVSGKVDIYPEPAAQLTRAFTTTTTSLGRHRMKMHWSGQISWHIIVGRAILSSLTGCTDASKLHLCIKSTSTYAQDWCWCPFASRTLPSPKSPGDVYFYRRFLHRVNHRWVSASILPFLPPECRARQGSPISLSIRHSQYTPRQARPIMEHSVCSIWKATAARSQGGGEGAVQS